MGVSEIVLLVLCLMAGVIVQRVTGMGSNLVIAPFLILIFGPVGGVVLVNMVGAVIAAILTAQLRQGIDRPVFVRLLAGALVGCVPGVLVVRAMPEELLTPLIGAILLLGLVLSRALAGRFARDFAHEGRSGLAVGAGFLSGATNVVSGAGGPPIAVFALVTDWDHRRFAATYQPYFVIVAVVSVVLALVVMDDALPRLAAPVWALVVASLLAGAALGGPVAARIPVRHARRGMILVSALGAASLLIGSVV